VPELLPAPSTAAALTMMPLAWAAFRRTDAIRSKLMMYQSPLELLKTQGCLA